MSAVPEPPMNRYKVEFEPYSRKGEGFSISAKGMSVTLDAISPKDAENKAVDSMRQAGLTDAKVKGVTCA